jgi:hypothetical protein
LRLTIEINNDDEIAVGDWVSILTNQCRTISGIITTVEKEESYEIDNDLVYKQIALLESYNARRTSK